MAVPKKRTSISKKKIRKNFWKKGGYWTALKGFFCNITDKPQGFFVTKKNVELQ
jgi:large subunit ribosomal protein L32